jgi:hypothetical protein
MNKNHIVDALLADQGGANHPGEIYIANEARFTSATFSQPLTTFSVGWKDDQNILASLQFIAPEVVVGRRFEFKKSTNAEEFLSETDDVRAIGSSFKRVEYKGTTVNEKTLNKGLTIRLDKDEMIDGDEERAVLRLKTRLFRNDLRRAVAILLAIDSGGTNKTWGSTGKPDSDVMGAIISAGDSGGISPNRLLYGLAAWQLRYASYEQQATAGAFAALNQTADQVAQKLGLSGGRVSSERYQSAASTKSKVVGSFAVVFFGEDGVGKDDPSSVKRFVTPVGPEGARVYRDEKDKFVDITVEHYSNLVGTSSVGTAKLNIS